jgi:sortase A
MPNSAKPGPVLKPSRRARSRIAERVLLAFGLLTLGLVSAAYLHRVVMLRISMNDFEKSRRETTPNSVAGNDDRVQVARSGTAPGNEISEPGYRMPAPVQSARRSGSLPLAILRIPKLRMEVPVLAGTDEITLNRGVGQIAGTATPGETGNIGIAGHRDSFFRNLKDITRGDAIELETRTGSETYIVDRILITDETDATVLRSREQPSITLVTCYPFHFVGPAPRRFVVQAHLSH